MVLPTIFPNNNNHSILQSADSDIMSSFIMDSQSHPWNTTLPTHHFSPKWSQQCLCLRLSSHEGVRRRVCLTSSSQVRRSKWDRSYASVRFEQTSPVDYSSTAALAAHGLWCTSWFSNAQCGVMSRPVVAVPFSVQSTLPPGQETNTVTWLMATMLSPACDSTYHYY